MSSGSPVTDFEEAITHDFAFVRSLGFDVSFPRPGLARFEGAGITISVSHQHDIGEIWSEVTVLDQTFPLAPLASIFDGTQEGASQSFTANSPEGVRSTVHELAHLVRKSGLLTTTDPRTLLQTLVELQEQYWRSTELSILARRNRPLAEEAFRIGGYARAGELYRQIVACLSPAEVRKLNYALARGGPRH